MAETYDYSTLNWVKGEIDETLDQARQALESYVDDPEDEIQLQFCVNHLHQVHGTLKMVELYGAVMVAEEMETVARALQEKKITKKEDAYEVLMRAILQLPNYLEHLQSGQKDVPIALLPLLNDMRATCGQSLLSESAFFSPDLSVTTPQVDNPEIGKNISELAKKLRHRYQMGLVSWFRDRDVASSLKQLADVVQALRRVTQEKNVAQLLWVADGVIEALIDNGIIASVSSKLLLGQVDREIKKIIDSGEQALVDERPVDLVKNLLYYVATATSSGELVKSLSSAFKLDELLAGTAGDGTEEGLSAVNSDVMETVTSAVKEDLTHIKDEIDIFIRAEQQDTSSLHAVSDALKKVADTLGMLGLGTQRNVVVEQAEVVKAIVDGTLDASDDAFMEMASGFLFVESSLNELMHGGKVGDAQGNVVLQSLKRLHGIDLDEPVQPAASGVLQESEQRELLKIVIREAKTDMARVKDAIVSFITAPWEHELLSDVPQLNRQVRGSMSMLSLDHAADLLSACNDYISNELIAKKDIPTQETLENLADVITSIEYYLEALDEDRSDRDEILSKARDCVAKIGYPVEGYIEPVAEARDKETPVTETPVTETPVAEIPVAEAPVTEAPVTEAPTSAAVTTASILEDDDNDIDQEIIDIFLEEAEEELETLATYFPKWKHSPEDEDSLGIVRRSFHTLKGSGRMVGASEIGEFAWSFENMLNRVIDHTVPASADLITLIERALDALPHLVSRFKGEEAPFVDIDALQDASHQMSQSGKLSRLESGEMNVPEKGDHTAVIASKESVAATQVMSNQDEDTAAEEPEGIDPVLLEIFTKESNRHVGDARAFIGQCVGQQDDCRINDDLVRAIHTLHGSAHMAGITDIAEVSSQMEKYVKLLKLNSASVTVDVTNLLQEFTSEIETRVSQLANQAENDDYKYALLDKISALYEHEVEAEELTATSTAERATKSEDDVLQAVTESASFEAEASDDEFDEELLEIFIEEGVEILDTSEVTLQNWINHQADKGLVEQLQREIHTLKGGARMAGIDPMGDLSHSLETMIIAIVEGRVTISAQLFDVVQLAHDSLVGMLDQVKARQPVDARQTLIETMDALTEGKTVDQREVDEQQQVEPEALATEELDTVTVEAEPEETVAVEAEEVDQGEIEELSAKAPETLSVEEQPDVSVEVEAETPAQGESEEIVVEAPETVTVEAETEEHADDTGSVQAAVEEQPVQQLAKSEQAPQVADDIVSEFPTPEQDVEEDVVIMPTIPAQEIEVDPEAEQHVKGRMQHEQIRVRADLLDELVNFAGEVSIYRSRVDQQVGAFAYNLTEMDQTIERVREQLRRFEIETEAQIIYRLEETGEAGEDFDPLEMDRFSNMQQLSRSLLESLNDLGSIQNLLENQTREAETLLLQQSRVNTELQEGLMRTRMVPFNLHLPRLRRLVRQTSNEVKKNVDLVVTGENDEMDRSVLDRVLPALEHMLRNAVDHGIESTEQRQQAGKKKNGVILIDISREGTEVVIRISDDGAGINLDAIREKANERGLLRSASDLTDKEVVRFILESGFSTASNVTQLSGRGVGMDVVNSEIKQLGGSLQIDTVRGQGTKFTVRLPLTLSVNKALMVHVGEDIYAIPLSSVDGVVRCSHEELEEFYSSNEPRYRYAGNTYRFMHLGTQLNISQPILPGKGSKLPVLLARAGDHRIALQVEALMGSREIVVKSVGPQISSVRAISGATILGDGSVALILDVGALVYMDIAQPAMHSGDAEAGKDAPVERGQVTVMVVDDSITVRKVTSRLLERNNMHVITAKDGVDAVTVLQEQIPDIFLLDIEMPRMDGYELATHIRNDSQMKDIPIIMITSRTGEKHRQRAMEIGVNQYLGKPYQEAELLQNIKEILDE